MGKNTLSEGKYIVSSVYRYKFNDEEIIQADENFLKILDLDCNVEDIIGKKLNNIVIYTEEKSGLKKQLKEKKEIHGYHYHFKTLKGDDRWVIYDSHILSAREEENQVVETKIQDITFLKISEKELFYERDRLSITLRSIGDAVITTDSKSNITMINRIAEELTGWKLSDALEVYVGKVFFVLDAKTHKPLANPVDMLIKGVRDDKLNEDLILISKNGKKIFITQTASLIANREGDILGAVLVFRDISEEKAALESLKKSEEKNKALLNAIPDLMFQFNSEGVFLDCHYSNEENLFQPPSSFLGKNVVDILPADLAEKTVNAIKRAKESGIIQIYEYSLKIGSEKKYFEARIVKSTEDRYFSIVRDVTDRKNAEESLKEREEQYRTLVVRASIGITMIQNDKIILTNPMLLLLLGYDENELKNKIFLDFVAPEERDRIMSFYNMKEDNFRELVNENDLDLIEDYYRRKKVRFDAPHIFETAMISKTGSKIFVQINSCIVHIRSEEAILILIRDITKQKIAEELLKKSEKLHRMLVENVSEGIFLLKGRKYEYVNPQFCLVTGYTCEELISPDFDISVLLAEESKELIEEKFKDRYVNEQTTDNYEIDIINKDGEKRLLEVSTQILDDSEEVYILGIIRDITEKKMEEQKRKELIERIQETQKLESLGILAGGIAHDFNNLLVGILGNSDLLLTDNSLSLNVKKMIGDIKTASERAAELSNQMLTYSGKAMYKLEPLNLNEVVKEMEMLLKTLISKNSEIKYILSENQPIIEGDITQLKQVILNLITNASESLDRGIGKITIKIGIKNCEEDYLRRTFIFDDLKPGKYISLEVSDTGIGIDKNTLKKIFDPFYSTKFTGRGLGLAAVLGIIRAHKGAIRVYSELERGSSFMILIPAFEKHSVELNHSTKQVDNWIGSGEILLADDDDVVRPVIKKMLENLGFNVHVVVNGYQALEVFRDKCSSIRCIILDLTMPGMFGEDTLKLIHEIKFDIPVIISSGYNEYDVRHRFKNEKYSAFLQKPYHISILIEKLKTVLEGNNK